MELNAISVDFIQVIPQTAKLSAHYKQSPLLNSIKTSQEASSHKIADSQFLEQIKLVVEIRRVTEHLVPIKTVSKSTKTSPSPRKLIKSPHQ
jgi:hypothetical protein